MLTILVFIAVLSVLVLAHEYGHFITAIKSGIKVEEFGIGFPPRLFGIYKKDGKWKIVFWNKEILDADGTVYSINLIPLGGFNKIKGENGGVDWLRLENRLIEKKDSFLSENLNPQEIKKYTNVLDQEANEIEIIDESFDLAMYKTLALKGKYELLLEFVKKNIQGDKDAFYTQKAWKKFLVLFSGPAMNFILAMFLLSIGFMIGLPEVIPEDQVDNLENPQIQIYEVFPDTPAAEAGFELGDFILSVDDHDFVLVSEISDYMANSEDKEVVLEIKRENEILELTVIPERVISGETEYVGVGISLVRVAVVKYPWYEAIWLGIKHTFLTIWMMLVALAGIIKSLFTTGEAGVALAGPVGIASLTGKFARMGFNYLLQFSAMFSINLGIINLLPFPALDGGRIIFVLWEKIKGKPINQKVEAWSHVIGFSLLILLIIFVTFKEVVALF